MKSILSCVLFLLLAAAARALDAFGLPVSIKPIARLETTDGIHYTEVVIINRADALIRFRHDAGVSERLLGEFDDVNLDRLFPGYLAHKAARMRAEEERERRSDEDERFVAAKLSKAVSEALLVANDELGRNDPCVCVLVAGRDTYEIGELPQIEVRIVNRSSKDIVLIGSLDGSAANWRFPRCRFEVLDPSGNPGEGSSKMCGNMNTLKPSDFVTISPGEAFNPFREGFFRSYPGALLASQQAGTYTVHFVYSTASRTVSDYFGDERMSAALAGTKAFATPEVQRLFDRTTHVELRSNELKLSFHAARE
jgi:hypothetical protein